MTASTFHGIVDLRNSSFMVCPTGALVVQFGNLLSSGLLVQPRLYLFVY